MLFPVEQDIVYDGNNVVSAGTECCWGQWLVLHCKYIKYKFSKPPVTYTVENDWQPHLCQPLFPPNAYTTLYNLDCSIYFCFCFCFFNQGNIFLYLLPIFGIDIAGSRMNPNFSNPHFCCCLNFSQNLKTMHKIYVN